MQNEVRTLLSAVSLTILSALVVDCGAAEAQLAFSVSREANGVPGLYYLDLEALSFEAIGNLSDEWLGLHAIDQSDEGLIYGVSWTGPQTADLFLVDPSSGIGTLIGPLELGWATGLAFGPGGDLWVVKGMQLERIDLSTGATLESLVLDQELEALAATTSRLYGIALSPSVGGDSLWEVNTQSGALSLVSELDGLGVGELDADFDDSGTLWMIGHAPGPIMGYAIVAFYKIPDPPSGEVIETFRRHYFVGDEDPLVHFSSLAMQPSPQAPVIEIPTISGLGSILSIGLLAALGAIRARSRRPE